MDLISLLRYEAKKKLEEAAAAKAEAATAAEAATGAEATPESVARAFSLAGRVAVVTGAATGIGASTALAYAAAGADLVLADVNDAGVADTATRISALGRTALVVPTDVGVKAEVDALATKALEVAGRIDVWANVAGIMRRALMIDMNEGDLDTIISVNLKGVYWGSAAAARVMTAAGRGSIINVASAGGEVPAPMISGYALTKAAVIMLTRTLAMEVGGAGVRANSLAPGFTDTPINAHYYVQEDGSVDEAARSAIFAARAAGSPLGLTAEPVDIAWGMLFLACDASRFMTGQVLRVNGGVHMA